MLDFSKIIGKEYIEVTARRAENGNLNFFYNGISVFYIHMKDGKIAINGKLTFEEYEELTKSNVSMRHDNGSESTINVEFIYS